MPKIVFGYWDMRGYGEPIRYLLHYRGVPFEDRRYSTADLSAWFEKDKFALGLDFPNLPYLFDGDFKMTQSTAILRYLAHKHDLAPKSVQDTARVDMVELQLIDFRDRLDNLVYKSDFDSLKANFVRDAPAQMKEFSDFLGHRKYFVGDYITYVDFLAYDTFDFYRLLIPDVLRDFQNLQSFQKNIEALPAIRKYMESPAYKRWPIFGPRALWGGRGDPPQRAE